MTLHQFVEKQPSQDHAARILCIPVATLNRWLKGHHSPSPMALVMLKTHGITKV